MRSIKHISRREARRLAKRIEELERHERIRNERWVSAYPGGVNILRIGLTPLQAAVIDTAMRLDCAIVGKLDGENNFMIYAVKP